MRALKAKYEFRTVSCYTCHAKNRIPGAPPNKTVRNDFGKLFEPLLKDKNIGGRAEQSAQAKKIDDDAQAEELDAGLTADFLEALGKVEVVKNTDGVTYRELLDKGEIEGVKLPED